MNYIRTAWTNEGAPSATSSRVAYLRDFADIPEGGVRPAVICPHAPARRLDEQTLTAIQNLLDDQQNLSHELPGLVRSYRERHPDLNDSEVVITLSGAYCRDVIQQSDQAFRESEEQFIRFMGDVGAIVAEDGGSAQDGEASAGGSGSEGGSEGN